MRNRMRKQPEEPRAATGHHAKTHPQEGHKADEYQERPKVMGINHEENLAPTNWNAGKRKSRS